MARATTGDHGQMIADVVERMTAIERALPAEDGVARFNDLYLAVTREVATQAGADSFEDPEFLPELDVTFAGLYFAAVDASDAHNAVDRAWAPLFEARARPKVAAIQFALAGMNAHINHDLCIALFATWRRRGIAPKQGSPQHRDYLKVNDILERVEGEVKERFAVGLVDVADEALGRLDDVLAMWSVARARDAAWAHAEILWALPADSPELADDYTLALGRLVGLAGRGLLIPTL